MFGAEQQPIHLSVTGTAPASPIAPTAVHLTEPTARPHSHRRHATIRKPFIRLP